MNIKYKDLTDKELCDLYVEHKQFKAFDEIYNRYFDDVYRFVCSRVQNKNWAEDITSDTFHALLDLLSKFEDKSKLKNFIIGISINKVKQYQYLQFKNKETSFDDNVFAEESENDISDENSKEIIKKIKIILKNLPKKYRQVLEERFLKSKSIRETSVKLKLSEQNVKVIQNRAIKKAAKINKDLYE